MISRHSEPYGFPVTGFVSADIPHVADLGEIVTKGVWSPIIWAGGTRQEHLFHVCSYCALDFDEGLTKEDAARYFRGYRFLIGPTKSDGIAKGGKAACDRFRMVIPFEEPIWDVDVYRYNMERVIKFAGGDPATADGARCWQPCKRVEYVSRSGSALPVDKEVPEEHTQRFRNQEMEKLIGKMRKQGVLPNRVKDFINGNVRPARRNKELFIASCVLLQFDYTVDDVREMVAAIPGMEDHEDTETTIRSAAKRVGADYT